MKKSHAMQQSSHRRHIRRGEKRGREGAEAGQILVPGDKSVRREREIEKEREKRKEKEERKRETEER